MSFFRKEINEVFTPRSADVNPLMYMERGDLEDELRQGLEGTQHLLLHGESGCGKSWLCRTVLEKESVFYAIANLANASRHKSITGELKNVVNRFTKAKKVRYSEKKSAEGGVVVAKGSLEHQTEYEISHNEPLEGCLQALRAAAGRKQCMLVLENLETIFADQGLMRELGDMIILLDDEAYSRHKVRFLIVGVPSGVREYFGGLPNLQTVANRLFELPQVGRLTSGQVETLVEKGFCELLKIDVHPDHPDLITDLKQHVLWITDAIPQYVHEYCLELAYLIKKNKWLLEPGLFLDADRKWLKRSLSKNYTIIDQLMNQRDTKVGRRNQVLYSLGRIVTETFRYTGVERVLRSEFPQSTAGVKLDVAGVLTQIAATPNAPIRLTPKGESYQFVDPRFRMCIRVMLVKTIDRIVKVDLATL